MDLFESFLGLGAVGACLVIGFIPFLGMILLIVFLVRQAQAEQARIDRLPVVTAKARVVAKRTETSGMSDGPVSTHYYATFELESGRRHEFNVSAEYGLLAEGDEGELRYRGPRFEGFRRVGPS